MKKLAATVRRRSSTHEIGFACERCDNAVFMDGGGVVE
jgi:ABC-type polar amino acid transport system ATPase subunit